MTSALPIGETQFFRRGNYAPVADELTEYDLPVEGAIPPAIGAGGVYRRCPASMELGAPCDEKVVVKDPTALIPVLAGMEQVMISGTGRGLAVSPTIKA